MNTKPRAAYFLPLALALLSVIACRFVTGSLPAGETPTAPVQPVETAPPAHLAATPVPADPPKVESNSEPALASSDLAAAEYCLAELGYYHEYSSEVSETGCFHLEDGIFVLQSTTDPVIRLTVSLLDKHSFGDLDNDGDGDAVATLAYNSGGSGTFILLAALINQDGQPVQRGTYYLGDRVVIEQITISDGRVAVEYIGHGPEDGLCCPSVPMSLALVYRQGGLLDAVVDQVGSYAEQAIQALHDRNMAALSQLVHPQWGLRFSPYAFVREDSLVFGAGQVAGLLQDNTIYQWGWYDGSGEPMLLTFAEYFDSFVYSMDFVDAPQISYNQRLGYGNTIDNARDFYPGAVVMEYYFPGQDPRYGGMDWRSLRLVFQQEGDRWYLVGIISDQWTI